MAVEEDLRPAQVCDERGNKEVVEVEEKTLFWENNGMTERAIYNV